jgi:hypothetical protein
LDISTARITERLPRGVVPARRIAMHPLLRYLGHLQRVRNTERGTPELSYRAALENLLNAVGDDLEPAVHTTAEIADTGAGHPDFGLFEVASGNERGVVEVKPVDEDTPRTADGSQVTRYGRRYGCVLVTNYRDFLLVVRQPDGKPRVEVRYQLAPDAESFWKTPPKTLAKQHAEPFADFLIGVMTRVAAIGRPKELAADLARHAREAKRRVAQHEMSALASLQAAMEQALGLHFSGEEGEAFFRSSLVQTLFYGLFSGWMLWRQDRHRPGTFDWKDASEYLALPLMGDLYEEIARPKRLADLDLRDPLDWATASLNRVDEEAFFERFDAEHAITLFYEPFLEKFDPKLRKELGVWYTPPEIVQYMVGRVDQLLRSELGIADGLADDQVYVLDPACGTGSYLVEVARVMYRTLVEQGHGSLAANRVKKALCSRLFGFEILPAPYVVAHLQLGVLLRSLGISLATDERCEVYLTNALTGWEPPKGPKQTLAFKFLADEQEAANRVKRSTPILVILGNPPYNRFAGVAEDEEADLIEPYKASLYEKWGVRKQLLDDLYIRFFRLAEKRIAEVGGRGIVSYISNYSWLDGLSHPMMRERLAGNFDQVWIDNCNGDKYRTGKRTPDGRPDESMFTTDEHPVGIQVGTAVATLVKRDRSTDKPKEVHKVARVQYRDFWGTGNEKRAQLIKSLSSARGGPRYDKVTPRPTMRWVFVNGELGRETEYETWPLLADLLPAHYSGLNENRQGALIADDPKLLEQRLKKYFDPAVPDDAIAEFCPALMTDAARFNARQTRQTLLAARETFDARLLVRLAFRPFDDLWVYWVRRTKLINEKRVEFFQQVWPGNVFISASQMARKGGFNQPTIVNKFGDLHLQDPWSQYFPLRVRRSGDFGGERIDPNVDPMILEAACDAFGIKPFEKDEYTWSKQAKQVAENIFYHTLAVLWTPDYRDENEAALRQDWPRIPIPADASVLDASAKLGHAAADLLLPDKPVPGVTTGKLSTELRVLGVPTKVGRGTIDPSSDLRVEAGWGFRGQKNAVMCGKGNVVPSTADPENALDVYLNDRFYWSNVPNDVWGMTIGGYPVIKKWLSYREFKVLGRPLRLEEMTYITEVIRRLKALLLLGPELDDNYRSTKQDTLKLNTYT